MCEEQPGIELSDDIIQAAGAWAQSALNNIPVCRPYPDDCKIINVAHQYPYLLNLAATLTQMEEQEDNEGLDQMYSGYGYRDCLRALHLAAAHPEMLPAPETP